MRLTKLDLAVVRSFADRAHASKSSRHLSHDGQELRGNWIGGHGIAEWIGDVVRFNDLGSRAAQTVQRALRKELLPKQVESQRRQMGNPMRDTRGGKVLATTFDDRELLMKALEQAIYEIVNRRRNGQIVTKHDEQLQSDLEALYNRIAEL